MPDLKIVQNVELPKKPVPIISIGGGGIVKDAHYPAYKKVGFPIAGVFDLEQKRAADLASQFGVPKVYATLEEAIHNAPPDAVFDIAVPASAILSILPIIPAGRGVLIQKPMGNNLAEARQIRDLCHKKNLTAAINFQMRYVPNIVGATSLIEQGAIGEVHDMEVRVTVYTPWHLWPFLVGIPRMEILYHSIHYLDLVRSFLGEPKGIYAKTLKHPKYPQLANARTNMILDYGDTLRANIETNHGHEYGLKHQESYVKWEGTKGAIKCQMGLNMNYPTGEPDTFEYCIPENGKPPIWEVVPVAGIWFPDAFIGTMSSLMRYMEGSSKVLPTSVDDAYKTMALVEAAYQSSEAGGTPIPT